MSGVTELKERIQQPLSRTARTGRPPTTFVDVPAGHPHEDDIALVVRRGIIEGTSATIFHPLAAVTREQMALYLVRLAQLVGIRTPPAAQTRFADIQHLSDESQAAIAQVTTRLKISRGTSATTYSPAQAVTRGQMALFTRRLMNLIPVLRGRGMTPDDMALRTLVSDIRLPFTDLGNVTLSTYEAIVQLHLLGVASGITETAYVPSALITRAALSGLLAKVTRLTEHEIEVSSDSRTSDADAHRLRNAAGTVVAHRYDRPDSDLLEEESDRIAREGFAGSDSTTFYVPHQQEDRLVEFDLLTSTIDDIIMQCGYPEDQRLALTEVHRRMAEHDLQDYQGPRPDHIPLLEGSKV